MLMWPPQVSQVSIREIDTVYYPKKAENYGKEFPTFFAYTK